METSSIDSTGILAGADDDLTAEDGVDLLEDMLGIELGDLEEPEKNSRFGQCVRYALLGAGLVQYSHKPSAGQTSFGWEEEDHPRDKGGQWTEGADAGEAEKIDDVQLMEDVESGKPVSMDDIAEVGLRHIIPPSWQRDHAAGMYRPPDETSKDTDELRQMRQLMGLDIDQINAYDPATAATKLGREWTIDTVRGTGWPSMFKTKREATEKATSHRDLLLDQYNDPKAYNSLVSLHASASLDKAKEWNGQGYDADGSITREGAQFKWAHAEVDKELGATNKFERGGLVERFNRGFADHYGHKPGAGQMSFTFDESKVNRDAEGQFAEGPDAGEKAETKPAEPPKPEPLIEFSPEDISYDAAYAAHAGSSFVPEKRARARQQEYADYMQSVVDELEPLAETPEQRLVLGSELHRFKTGYLAKMHAMLAADSRTMSSMITGPSNFPVRSNQKKLDTAHKRLTELIDFTKKGLRSIRKTMRQSRSPEQVSSESLDKIKLQIGVEIAVAKKMEEGDPNYRGMDLMSFKSSLANKIKTIAKSGDAETTAAALDYLRDEQKKLKKPLFTDRHGVWKLGEKAAETKAEPVKTGVEDVGTFGDAEVVNNHDEERVQISFPGKPDAEMRGKLKGAGWHWSPRNGVWQRKNTANAVASAKMILRDRHARPGLVERFNRGFAEHYKHKPGAGQMSFGWDESKVSRDAEGQFAESGTASTAKSTANDASGEGSGEHPSQPGIGAIRREFGLHAREAIDARDSAGPRMGDESEADYFGRIEAKITDGHGQMKASQPKPVELPIPDDDPMPDNSVQDLVDMARAGHLSADEVLRARQDADKPSDVAAEMNRLVKEIAKSTAKLDKMNAREMDRLKTQGRSRGRSTTASANASNEAERRDDHKGMLRQLARDELTAGREVPQSILDVLGSQIEYNAEGNYEPIEAQNENSVQTTGKERANSVQSDNYRRRGLVDRFNRGFAGLYRKPAAGQTSFGWDESKVKRDPEGQFAETEGESEPEVEAPEAETPEEESTEPPKAEPVTFNVRGRGKWTWDGTPPDIRRIMSEDIPTYTVTGPNGETGKLSSFGRSGGWRLSKSDSDRWSGTIASGSKLNPITKAIDAREAKADRATAVGSETLEANHAAVMKILFDGVDKARGDWQSTKQRAAIEQHTEDFVKAIKSYGPKALRDIAAHTAEIELFPDREELNHNIFARTGDPAFNGNSVGGVYSHVTGSNRPGKLYLDGGGMGRDQYNAADVHAHELGHAIDGPGRKYSKQPQWRSAWRAEIGDRKGKVYTSETGLADDGGFYKSRPIKDLKAGDTIGLGKGKHTTLTKAEIKKMEGGGPKYMEVTYTEDGHIGQKVEKWKLSVGVPVWPMERLPDAPLTAYATTKPSEGWAEFARAVAMAPEDTKKRFPKCWGLWEKWGLVNA